MRKTLLLLALLLPQAALAHVGHLDELGGHDHYIAAWALFGAIVGALWLIRAEMRRPKEPRKVKRAEDDEAGA